MGHKVSPNGLRVGINRNWNSRWFVEKNKYSDFLLEDIMIRKYLNESKICKSAILSHVEIERKKNYKGIYNILVKVFVAKPGVIFKQDNVVFDNFKKKLSKKIKFGILDMKIIGVENPNLDANIVAKWVALELEKRANFRVIQKKAIAKVKEAGAIGCRTLVSGRLNGADIARSEGYKDGTIPLHTLRSNIDFAVAEAKTTYGNLGVKIWICHGHFKNNKKTFNNGDFENKLRGK